MKKVRYDEPKMPESLRKLMDLDAEDSIRDSKATVRKGAKKVSKTRPKSQINQGKQKKINDRGQERKPKKVKVGSKSQPKKLFLKRRINLLDLEGMQGNIVRRLKIRRAQV